MLIEVNLKAGGQFLIHMEGWGFNLNTYPMVSEVSCCFALQRELRSIFRGSEAKG